MLAIFCFFDRDETALGNIVVHQGSSEYDQLLVAGYSFRLFERDTARNYVDTAGDYEHLAARYQTPIEYAGGGGIALPIKRDQHGNATFGGLHVGQPAPWSNEFADEDRDPSDGW